MEAAQEYQQLAGHRRLDDLRAEHGIPLQVAAAAGANLIGQDKGRTAA